MKKRNVRLLLITTMLILMSSVLSLHLKLRYGCYKCTEVWNVNFTSTIRAIVLAFITKNVIVSLVIWSNVRWIFIKFKWV